MRDFFKPWRRKVGCVTLGLACVFVVGWIRSQNSSDTIAICDGSVIYYFSSGYLGLELETHAEYPKGSSDEFKAGILRCFTEVMQPIKRQKRFATWEFAAPFLGVQYGETRLGGTASSSDRWRIWIIPHWYIAVPLTALSACLLLGKPPAKSVLPPNPDHA